MKNFLCSIAVLICAASLSTSFAVEANGLLVSVYKRTTGKKDVKTENYSGTDKSITLAVTVKNISLRKMPEGELRWKIMVKKGYGYITEKLTGVELIKPLHPSETVEILVGPAKVGEYHSGRASDYSIKEYKDKLDYEITIAQDEQELLRVGSDPDFAKSLNTDSRIAAGGLPKPRSDDAPKPLPIEAKPVETKPLIGKEETPAGQKPPTASVANSNPPPTLPVQSSPPAPEYSAARPFDFFNLGTKQK